MNKKIAIALGVTLCSHSFLSASDNFGRDACDYAQMGSPMWQAVASRMAAFIGTQIVFAVYHDGDSFCIIPRQSIAGYSFGKSFGPVEEVTKPNGDLDFSLVKSDIASFAKKHADVVKLILVGKDNPVDGKLNIWVDESGTCSFP